MDALTASALATTGARLPAADLASTAEVAREINIAPADQALRLNFHYCRFDTPRFR